MNLMICLLCDEEPFACPDYFWRTYMRGHMDMVHRLRGVKITPQIRSGGTFWSINRGRHAEPVLKVVELQT